MIYPPLFERNSSLGTLMICPPLLPCTVDTESTNIVLIAGLSHTWDNSNNFESKVKKLQVETGAKNGMVNKVGTMLGTWFGILSLAMVLIFVVIYKRLKSNSQRHDITTLNDSESAFADSVYNKSSVVDFDGPFRSGKWNMGFESPAKVDSDRASGQT